MGEGAVVDADPDQHRLHRQLGHPRGGHGVPGVPGPRPDQGQGIGDLESDLVDRLGGRFAHLRLLDACSRQTLTWPGS